MRRVSIYSFCLLLTTLPIFAAGCAKTPEVVVQPQPQLPVKRGNLVVMSEPIGAEVRIDDKAMDTTPLALKEVPVGSYRVEMELEHYKAWSGSVDVKDRQMAEVRAQLEPEPVALDVKSEPTGAIVRIDGGEVGPTPYSGWVTADAEHIVSISAKGYRFESQKVTVLPGGKGEVSVALEKAKAGELAPIIIGMDGAEMILIPAGDFLMGSPEGEGDYNEHPQQTVFVDSFYMDKYEVTNAQYKQFMDATGYKAPNFWESPEFRDSGTLNQPNYPVVGVDWYDAKAYCHWAGKRLPTEPEREKAARGGLEGKTFPWGDSITHDDANYDGTGGKDIWSASSPVGSFAPNGYGLYDMAGNVWEWCASWYMADQGANSLEQNPAELSSGSSGVSRGGSWNCDTYMLRAAFRNRTKPWVRYVFRSSGFRGVVAQH